MDNTDDKDYVITLDDGKEYVLVNTIENKGQKYVYMVELDNNENCLFAELNGYTIKMIEDENLLRKVITEFAKLEGNN